MKPFNAIKMKSLFKKAIVLGMASALIVSCGKENKVSSSTYTGSSPVFQNNPQAGSYFESLKSKYQCSGRLQDYTFTVGGGGSSVAGTQRGYVGKSQFNDLIYILPTGSSYSVVVSLCTQGTLISASNPPSNFQVSGGFSYANGCQSDGFNGTLLFNSSNGYQQYQVPTSFYGNVGSSCL